MRGNDDRNSRFPRRGFTGDFLNEAGSVACGDAGLDLFSGRADVQWQFISELAPRANDPSYWASLYSMEVRPEHIKNIDGLVVLRPWVKKSTFASGADNLVVIGRSGAGYDKIDLDACTEAGVAVFNAPLALNHSTASSALLFMLALAKRLPEQERITRAGRWDRQAEVLGGEIAGRTLGIVGLGHSGRELVRLVAPFGMRILAYSPHADARRPRSLAVRLTSLAELMHESDFVSLHCRLSEATRELITAEKLAIMKPTAYLINVGRGELVDQRALAARSRSKDRRGRARCLRGRAIADRRSTVKVRQRDPDPALVGIDVGRVAGHRAGHGPRDAAGLERPGPGKRRQSRGAQSAVVPQKTGKIC